jgi:hypothetical protein
VAYSFFVHALWPLKHALFVRLEGIHVCLLNESPMFNLNISVRAAKSFLHDDEFYIQLQLKLKGVGAKCSRAFGRRLNYGSHASQIVREKAHGALALDYRSIKEKPGSDTLYTASIITGSQLTTHMQICTAIFLARVGGYRCLLIYSDNMATYLYQLYLADFARPTCTCII